MMTLNLEGWKPPPPPMNREQMEAHWRSFMHAWEMFIEGALYESLPDMTPWDLLEYKRAAWLEHLGDRSVE